ncbi:uncharacterized protein LOC143358140 [Halictus rubicundus]|uniref:uncharacterized protein LOC143358140 n=1 Tax=Halictus rubicundus TaxID=77578 RepID=UPI004036A871
MLRKIVVLMVVILLVATDAKKVTTPKPPKKCPKNEVWSWCGKVCEPDCGILQPGWTVCPNFKCTDKTGDCRCRPGLVRNEKHVCIDLEKCKNRHNFPYELQIRRESSPEPGTTFHACQLESPQEADGKLSDEFQDGARDAATISRKEWEGTSIREHEAVTAAAENSTATADDHKLMEHSSQKVQLAENTTENPAEGFKLKNRDKERRRRLRECGDLETWSRCGKACENTCKRRGFCMVKICDKEWDGCRCKLGYVRNRKGKCVRPRDCKMCNNSNKKSAPKK